MRKYTTTGEFTSSHSSSGSADSHRRLQENSGLFSRRTVSAGRYAAIMQLEKGQNGTVYLLSVGPKSAQKGYLSHGKPS